MAEDEELNRWVDEEYSSDTFKHGVSLGTSLGLYEAHVEAIAAYDAGEIELWIAMVRPKTLEEWDVFHREYGSNDELHARWKVDTAEDS